jgi:hypothetical protein
MGRRQSRPNFGIGVVYSQAKDGKQARLVSNAQIKKNKPLYLPDAWANIPEDNGIPSGRCAVNAREAAGRGEELISEQVSGDWLRAVCGDFLVVAVCLVELCSGRPLLCFSRAPSP